MALAMVNVADFCDADVALLARGAGPNARVEFSSDSSLIGLQIERRPGAPFRLSGYMSTEHCVLASADIEQWHLVVASRTARSVFAPSANTLGLLKSILDASLRMPLKAAGVDALTQLPDREATLSRLREAIAVAKRAESTAAVLFIDVDRFKSINDRYGHVRGDEVLKTIAQRMRAVLRENEFVGRVGGDEFVLVISALADASSATNAAQRLCEAISALGEEISLSIGIALTPAHGLDTETLLSHADVAMYRAKRSGECSCVYDADWTLDAQSGAIPAVSISAKSLPYHLVFCVQPIFNALTGAPERVEALPRFSIPGKGMVPAAAILRQNNVPMSVVDAWVLESALQHVASWRSRFGVNRIHMNCSIEDENELGALIRIVTNAGPQQRSCIGLEIQNGGSLRAAHFARALSDLRATGAHVGLDAFLAEKLSISQLTTFDISFIKMFAPAISNPQNRRAIKAVAALAKVYSWDLMATHVEQANEVLFLCKSGAAFVQGYALSPPLTALDFEQWVVSWRAHAGPPQGKP